MKCPYILNDIYNEHSKPVGYRHQFSDDEDDCISSVNFDTTYTLQRLMTECIQDGCAAWQDGKCKKA
jgi:hypothetical protein